MRDVANYDQRRSRCKCVICAKAKMPRKKQVRSKSSSKSFRNLSAVSCRLSVFAVMPFMLVGCGELGVGSPSQIGVQTACSNGVNREMDVVVIAKQSDLCCCLVADDSSRVRECVSQSGEGLAGF